MKRFSMILLSVLCAICLFCTAAFAQQITSEVIGPLSGNLVVNYAFPDACAPQSDTVAFTGNVHVVAIVDTSNNTMDIHVNLMTVKGTGTISTKKYIGTGATSLLDQPFSLAPPRVSFGAKLYPPDPCREGFVADGALPLSITLGLAQDFTLSTTTATVGQID